VNVMSFRPDTWKNTLRATERSNIGGKTPFLDVNGLTQWR
jgi:hypothetical protein